MCSSVDYILMEFISLLSSWNLLPQWYYKVLCNNSGNNDDKNVNAVVTDFITTSPSYIIQYILWWCSNQFMHMHIRVCICIKPIDRHCYHVYTDNWGIERLISPRSSELINHKPQLWSQETLTSEFSLLTTTLVHGNNLIKIFLNIS